MMILLKKLQQFIKSDPVEFIAIILAFLTSCIVKPDKQYFHYIDYRTLSILFCLMLVTSGLRTQGVFDKIGLWVLQKAKTIRSLAFICVFLCFFSGMFITNDVALITFVPFTIEILAMGGLEEYMISVIVLQTIAANLGSMLTPIGNPQNLYLYSLSNLSLWDFILLMLPYTFLSLLLLSLCILFLCGKKNQAVKLQQHTHKLSINRKIFLLYGVLFFLSLLVVAKMLPYSFVFVITLISVLLWDYQNLKKPDYGLLFTFFFLFIFIGNLVRIPMLHDFFAKCVKGNELILSILTSQITSNVPAALLLSGFTKNIKALIIGTNLGGLGTIIASMASLISYKLYAKNFPTNRLQYIRTFTIFNVIILLILIIINGILHIGI